MVKSLSAATQLFKRPYGLFKRHFRGCLKVTSYELGILAPLDSSLFTLHSSLFTLFTLHFCTAKLRRISDANTSYDTLTCTYDTLMIYLRAIRCTYEGSQLLKWRGSPVGMPMKRCKNGVEKMQGRRRETAY